MHQNSPGEIPRLLVREKLARRAPSSGISAKNSPSAPENSIFGPFWVCGANCFTLTHTPPGQVGRQTSRAGLRNMATLKPTTPLQAQNKGPMKPASPLRPKTAPKCPFLARKGDGGFNPTQAPASKGDRGFRQPGHLADGARLRRTRAAAGPGLPQKSHAILLGEYSIKA